MKLYMKQKVFSWGDRFRVYDEDGREYFYVQGEVFSFGKKLHVFGADGNEVSFIHQKVMSFLPRFYIAVNGIATAEVTKQISFLRQSYLVKGPDWQVSGDFLAHEYTMEKDGIPVAVVSKHWLTWGDTYEIDIARPEDAIMALSVVLVIDAVMAQAAAASHHSN